MFLLSLFCIGIVPKIHTQDFGTFGDPLSGLAPGDLALFTEGKEAFGRVERIEDGLGPIFNGVSCLQCHTVSPIGGGGFINELRLARVDADGSYHDLPGGSLLHFFSIDSTCKERVLPEANVRAFRQTVPLFGSGLIEAIPDETILAHSRPEDPDEDGIRGRANMVLDPASRQMRVGRFGWKAQQATLLGFAAAAYLDELGITNELFPHENAPNGEEERLMACDRVPDPEDKPGPSGRRRIDKVANFMRFLRPPPRAARTPEVIRGEQIFSEIGCSKCHTPTMETGEGLVSPLRSQPVPLFSDLLLHDVGTGDGIVQDGARANELRTAPLWGVRASAPYLHDGTAATLEEAVNRHAGEASRVTQRFRGLTTADQRGLLAFLDSL